LLLYTLYFIADLKLCKQTQTKYASVTDSAGAAAGTLRELRAERVGTLPGMLGPGNFQIRLTELIIGFEIRGSVAFPPLFLFPYLSLSPQHSDCKTVYSINDMAPLTVSCLAGNTHPELLPCGYLVGDSNTIVIRLKGELDASLRFVSFSPRWRSSVFRLM